MYNSGISRNYVMIECVLIDLVQSCQFDYFIVNKHNFTQSHVT